MKKCLSLLLALCLCLSLVPSAAQAEEDSAAPAGLAEVQTGETDPEPAAAPSAEPSLEPSPEPSPEPESSDFVIEDGVLTGYRGPGGDVAIPDSVTFIAGDAFRSRTSLTSVTIPDGVTGIGSSAFWNCSSLTSVTIPDSVTRIGPSAFEDCTGLTSVTLPKGITEIGAGAFSGCTGLTSVTIPDSMTTIGRNAFEDCTGLTSVALGSNVTEIGEWAFHGCTGLTSMTFPNGLTKIGDNAFAYCTGLTSLTFPDSVTYIGKSAFCYCADLTSVTIPDSVKEIGGLAFEGCTSLKAVTVPSSVAFSTTSWPAFPDTTEVTLVGHNFTIDDGVLRRYRGPGGDITIPDGVTEIDEGAFYNCTSLTSVTIPDSVKKIGNGAFSGCTNLATAVVPSTTEFYATDRWFSFPKTTKVILVGHSFTIIGSVLKGYKGPGGDITIPDGVTTIDSNAFKDRTDITGVTFPDSLTAINSNAFSGCTGLKSVSVPSSVTMKEDAFPSTTKLNQDGNYFGIENGVIKKYVGPGGALTIPDGVTRIPSAIFKGRTDITSVTFPDSLTYIEENAFRDCTGLKSVTFPSSMTARIGSGAFFGCTGLKNVNVPSSVVMEKNAFPSTTKLNQDGHYFGIKDGLLVAYQGAGGDVVIPDGVTGIRGPYQYGDEGTLRAPGPFEGNTTITSITLPDSLTTIESYSSWFGGQAECKPFSGCTNLKSIVFGNGLKTLPELSDLPALERVVLPSGLTSIPDRCFMDCSKLTDITIPSGVTSIGKGAFYDSGISSLVIPEGVKTCGTIMSSNLRELTLPSTLESRPTLSSPSLRKVTFPKNCWAFKGISRADLVKYLQGCPRLEEIVNCPNEYLDDLIAPNRAIRDNWTNPKSAVVAQSARITQLSNEITAGLTTDYDKAKAISQWVVSHIKYDNDYYYAALKDYSDVPFDPEEILDKGQAVCAGYARLTQALLAAQGIPCLYVLGYAGGYHAWNLALLDGDYLWIDNTWGMDYFALGTYAFSRDHQATSAAAFNGVKGPGTLVDGAAATKDAALEAAEKAGIGTAMPETLEETLARETIEALKEQYPEGMSWTNGNSYYSEGLRSTGSGCAGFAYLCSDAVFDKAPAAEPHSDFNKIRVGDILRIDNDTHSVVVLRKMSDGVIVTEGNYNSSIHWDRAISRADLEKGGLKVTTRWGTKAAENTAAANSVLPSASGTAYASTQTVDVDGKAVTFECYALKNQSGSMTNYIKLRDLAMLLNGTAAQFQVGWDGNVTITTKTAYTPNGSELKTPFSGDRDYRATSAVTRVNGQTADLAAFMLTDDRGGGYTYYQLRELGQAIGFNVGWSAEKGIYLETDKPYDANN